MSFDERLQSHNAELLDIMLQMGSAPDFDSSRPFARRLVPRSFEPDFFPAILQLLGFLADTGGKNEAICLRIFAAIVSELRDFLGAYDAERLGATAVCLECNFA